MGGLRDRAPSGAGPARRAADRRRPARRRRGARRARRGQADHLFLTTLATPSDKAETAVNGAMVGNLLESWRTPRSGACRPGHRAQALSWAVRAFRAQPARDAAARGAAAHPAAELLLPPGGHWCSTRRGGAASPGASPSAYVMIGYAVGSAVNMGVTLAVYAAICRETGRRSVPGLARAARRRERRHRRPAARAPSRLGGNRLRTRSRPSTSSRSSAALARGRGWPRYMASRRSILATPSPWSSRWPARGPSGSASSRARASFPTPSSGSPPGGARTRISAARSNASPT